MKRFEEKVNDLSKCSDGILPIQEVDVSPGLAVALSESIPKVAIPLAMTAYVLTPNSAEYNES